MKKQGKSKFKIYIDTAKRDDKKVSLVKIVGDEEKIVDTKEGQIDIVSSIRDLLSKNKLVLEDISEFVPNLGPGSFTGLKVGVAISNVLNKALGRKDLKDLYLPEYGGEPNISKKKDCS